jgi:AcrR family transcriptional regulator
MTTDPPPATKRRKDAILDEATRLFAERGYAACSMADLAECVGLRKASLFHHFPSKDDLYGAVLERLMKTVSETIARSISTGSFEEQLDRMSDGMVTAFGEHPFAARIVAREMMDWGPFARTRFGELVAPVLQASETFLKAGQESGTFAKRDVHQLMFTLMGLHVLPFAVGEMVKSLTQLEAASPEFVARRRTAVRDHVRALVLAGPGDAPN